MKLYFVKNYKQGKTKIISNYYSCLINKIINIEKKIKIIIQHQQNVNIK